MKSKVTIVKIGGNVINDKKLLDRFLDEFAKLEQPKVLVHGGGRLASELSKKLKINTLMDEGRRITSSETLEVVTMVYAGLVNKNIVSQLQKKKCNALGLSGADANCILAVKRPVSPIDFGWVGDVQSINDSVVNSFLENGITPIFCAITHDGEGQLLNTNADTVASEVAIALSKTHKVELIYCFEKKGVLSDIKNEESVINEIDSTTYLRLKQEQLVHEGMIPKIENCFNALRSAVSKVKIGDLYAIREESLGTKFIL